MPTISVIVPVYKVEAYLHRCIDSILAQTCKDFELILVDDGSPDNCGAICDEYAAQDSRVIVIHQENGGISAARNAGIDWMMANSDSQWLSFVDSDDYIHPKMLEVLLDAVVSTDTKISICGFQRTSGEDLVVDDIPTPQLWKPEDYYLQHAVNATVAWGKLYHRECFKDIRYPVGRLHEDEFVTYRILFRYSALSVILLPLYGYYQNETGIMGSPWQPARMDVLDALCHQMQFFIDIGCDNVIIQNILILFDGNIQTHLCHILSYPKASNRKEYLKICRNATKRILKLYRSRFHYSLLDYQHLYEFIYPAPLIRFICNGWKLLSTIKSSLKGR